MIFYDFEVFECDWVVVLIDMEREEETVIINDREKLESYHSTNVDWVWVGYNSRHYDQYILKGILTGFNPKRISDYIIVEQGQGWAFSDLLRTVKLINYDVALGIDRGLKVFEGYMGNDIRESSVPFDIKRKLTDRELDEVVQYCRHDVEQTVEVFLRRKDEFDAHMHFIKEFNLPLNMLNKTKAQLASYLLGGNGRTWDDEFNFPFLSGLDLGKYDSIRSWYRDPNNWNYDKSLNMEIAGVPHTLAWGGLHAGRKQYIRSGWFINADVTAYYPALQIAHGIGKRVIGNWANFERVHNANLEFKKLGDKKARLPYKILDNAISGQMKQKGSKIYDPMSNNTICVNGQLCLVDLIDKVEGYAELVQSNTDGILLYVPDRTNVKAIRDAVADWEARTGVAMEVDLIQGKVFQKDVNNYLLYNQRTGKVKSKGAYVKPLNELDYELAVVNRALVDYMVKGVPVQKTIMECDDLKDFQMVRKISSKYSYLMHGSKVLKEKCVRVFASKVSTDGGLRMKPVKKATHDKVANTPEHCFLWNESVNGISCPDKLDKEWYIDLALKRLKDYGVTA